MSPGVITTAWLRLRIALAAANPVALGALVLCIGAALALSWLVPARAFLGEQAQLARASSVAALAEPAAAPIVLAPPATDEHHLALFYGALGERRQTEQQVKALFALAAKSGLVLRQGEYKAAYDRNARVHSYQVTMPVKGNYGAIWRFALGALRAIPFAALDEISFKRDAIGDAQVEARIRLTLYLNERPGAAP